MRGRDGSEPEAVDSTPREKRDFLSFMQLLFPFPIYCDMLAEQSMGRANLKIRPRSTVVETGSIHVTSLDKKYFLTSAYF